MSWRDRTPQTLAAVRDHKLTHPECRGYTVTTIHNNRVNPPEILQRATCLTCGERFA